MKKPLLVFDMDGVLIDVTESYRETIIRTVAHFTGKQLDHTAIQGYKNEGGWNDDWQLSHHIVTNAGVDAPFETVKAEFQRLFLDNGEESLMLREKWVARPGKLEALNEQFDFALFTGRPQYEAGVSLRRFAPALTFAPLIAMENVEQHKPAPEGLLKIVSEVAPPSVYYIGDTVDDARCARAAKVPFIGIAAPSNPLYLDLVFLFQEVGSYAIVDDINYLDEVFPV